MDIIIKAAQLLLSLSLLIIVHELGHFIFARIFKCRVEKFYLFFNLGFSLFKTKRGETEYGIGWLPLGGYVKIAGMIDESMDKEQMKQPAQPWEFRSKKPYQRLLIMVGGVMMNFLAALIIYIGVLYAWGEEYLPTANVKYGIEVNEVGREIGFQNGDKILAVDGEYIERFYDIAPSIVLDGASTVQVERNGQQLEIPITKEHIAKMVQSKGVFGVRVPFNLVVGAFGKESPAQQAGIQKNDQIVMVNHQQFTYHDEFAQVLSDNRGKEVLLTVIRDTQQMDIPVTISEKGMLGVSWSNNHTEVFEFETLRYGFFESIPAGIARGWETSVDYIKQFKLIFSRDTKGYESLGGFITIGNIFPGMWNWKVFWNMTAFLSIILGIMNILPIPALDGGHVMFVLYEMISGRKPNEKFLEYAQYVGLTLLLLLVFYANMNDVIRLFK
ncbi:MAG: RIP metalloprotease RseP [Prolixibacteraceae bacterium]|nr:RIP metalloprotease RseP [Prolixibacteraceae bacterium]